jgi:uncharacterized lipoprotein YddW (UPF0748 family)
MVWWLIMAAVVVLGLAAASPAASPTPKPELRGVYLELHGNRAFGAFPLLQEGDWRGLLHSLKELGVNTILPNVVSPAGAIYPSTVVPTLPLEARQGHPDLLKVIAEAAHLEGLEVHPWTIEWYHAPRETDPDRLAHDPEGKTTNSLCPSVPENRDLMQRMLLELAKRPDIDGLQYDYIRFPEGQYCYCRHCRAGFESRLGHSVANWPADVLPKGSLESQYVDYLCDTISSFVQDMHDRLKAAHPRLVLSAAVWCVESGSRHVGVRQDWGRWAEQGWVDFVAPMNYGNKWVVANFERFARNEAKMLTGKRPFVFGAGAYLDTPEGVVKAAKLGRDLGASASGLIVYTLTENTFANHLPALHKEVWTQPAMVPAFGRR